MATIPDSCSVFLCDHAGKEVNTAGLLPSHSRIYVTIGPLASMSDEGMRGVTTYENAHVHRHRIFTTFIYVCCFAVNSHLLDNSNFFFAAFLLLLGVRRYCKYRVDIDATQSIGREAILTALCELAVLYPSKSQVCWSSSVNTYPTLAMRIWVVKIRREVLL